MERSKKKKNAFSEQMAYLSQNLPRAPTSKMKC